MAYNWLLSVKLNQKLLRNNNLFYTHMKQIGLRVKDRYSVIWKWNVAAYRTSCVRDIWTYMYIIVHTYLLYHYRKALIVWKLQVFIISNLYAGFTFSEQYSFVLDTHLIRYWSILSTTKSSKYVTSLTSVNEYAWTQGKIEIHHNSNFDKLVCIT